MFTFTKEATFHWLEFYLYIVAFKYMSDWNLIRYPQNHFSIASLHPMEEEWDNVILCDEQVPLEVPGEILKTANCLTEGVIRECDALTDSHHHRRFPTRSTRNKAPNCQWTKLFGISQFAVNDYTITLLTAYFIGN